MRIGVTFAAIALTGIISFNAVAQKAEATKQKPHVVSEKGKDSVACPMHKGMMADKSGKCCMAMDKKTGAGAAKHMMKQGDENCCGKGTSSGESTKGCEGMSKEGCGKECNKETKAGKH
jgi:hypothetical protein